MKLKTADIKKLPKVKPKTDAWKNIMRHLGFPDLDYYRGTREHIAANLLKDVPSIRSVMLLDDPYNMATVEVVIVLRPTRKGERYADLVDRVFNASKESLKRTKPAAIGHRFTFVPFFEFFERKEKPCTKSRR